MRRRKIPILIFLVLSTLFLFQFLYHGAYGEDIPASAGRDPYIISPEDYIFPKNGLEKKNNASELAETVLEIFDMDLEDQKPEISTSKWQVTGPDYTKYTYIIGERKFFNEYENGYITRSHELDLIYLGDLFYCLEINFDWNLGGNLEEDAFHIIDSMQIPEMDMRIERMDVDGGLKIRSEGIGFNDTNMVELYERSAYYVDDGVWEDGRELRIGAWLNVSWNDLGDTQVQIDNMTGIGHDFILENYPLSRNRELLWIYGAWDRDLTWFKIDPSNGTFGLNIRSDVRLMFHFSVPGDEFAHYVVQVNISTWNNSITGSLDWVESESSQIPYQDQEFEIIHYYPDTGDATSDPEGDDLAYPRYLPMLLPIILIFLITTIAITSRINKKNILDNLTRKRIFDTINENQGIHFRDIMRKIGIKQGVLGYHLNILEEENYIKSIQRGNKRCFFTRDDKGDLKLKLNMAQQRILNEINLNPGISLTDLAKVTHKAKTLVYYHTSILAETGLIEKEKYGKQVQFFVSDIGENYIA